MHLEKIQTHWSTRLYLGLSIPTSICLLYILKLWSAQNIWFSLLGKLFSHLLNKCSEPLVPFKSDLKTPPPKLLLSSPPVILYYIIMLVSFTVFFSVWMYLVYLTSPEYRVSENKQLTYLFTDLSWLQNTADPISRLLINISWRKELTWFIRLWYNTKLSITYKKYHFLDYYSWHNLYINLPAGRTSWKAKWYIALIMW